MARKVAILEATLVEISEATLAVKRAATLVAKWIWVATKAVVKKKKPRSWQRPVAVKMVVM